MSYIGKSVKAKRVRYTPQSTTPVNPTEGDVYYSDGTPAPEGLYVYQDGSWIAVGSTLTSEINYIDNFNAELGTDGWNTYKDAAQDTPEDGNGGSPVASIFNLTLSPALRGSQSFTLTTIANAQGEGVSYDFSIDERDKAQPLTVSLDYRVDSSYSDADVKIYFYDVDNTTLISTSDVNIQNSGIDETYIATFQTSATSLNYRMIAHIATTRSGLEFGFDNIQVGPRMNNTTAVTTDWQDFTPTLSASLGTVTGATGQWRRVGSNMELKGSFTTGATGIGLALLTIPNGHITSNDLFGTHGDGDWSQAVSSTSDFKGGTFQINTGNSVLTFVDNKSKVTSSGTVFSGPNANIMFFSTTLVSFSVSIPIQGWESTQVIADEYANRNIMLEARGGSGTVFTALVTPIAFTEVEDSTASWSGDTFTTPSPGEYSFEGAVHTTATLSGSHYLYINGVQDKIISIFSSNSVGMFSANITLAAGDQVTIRSGISGTATTGNGNLHHLKITRIKDARSILAGEKVFARATTDSGQSIPNAVSTTVVFEDVDEDTHGSLNTSTGVYTIKDKGIYTITANSSVNASAVAGTIYSMSIVKNGSDFLFSTTLEFEVTSTTRSRLGVAHTIKLEVGDTIEISVFQNTGSTQNLEISSGLNTFSIVKE